MHSSRHVFGAAATARRGDLEGRIRNAEFATQDAVHPVVIRHPDTGRKDLAEVLDARHVETDGPLGE